MSSRRNRVAASVKLGRKAWAQAQESITDAFSEDPCLKYLLASDVYDPQKARYIHGYTLRVGSLYGQIFISGGSCEAVSIWMPPGRSEVSTWMFIRSGGLSLRKTVDPGIIARLQKYGDYSSELHHRNAPMPHWYLLSIAVAERAQGKGLAKAVMLPMLRHLDESGEACYLETHNPRNVAFYEKFGFSLVEKGRLPDSDITHYSMLRHGAARSS